MCTRRGCWPSAAWITLPRGRAGLVPQAAVAGAITFEVEPFGVVTLPGGSALFGGDALQGLPSGLVLGFLSAGPYGSGRLATGGRCRGDVTAQAGRAPYRGECPAAGAVTSRDRRAQCVYALHVRSKAYALLEKRKTQPRAASYLIVRIVFGTR